MTETPNPSPPLRPCPPLQHLDSQYPSSPAHPFHSKPGHLARHLTPHRLPLDAVPFPEQPRHCSRLRASAASPVDTLPYLAPYCPAGRAFPVSSCRSPAHLDEPLLPWISQSSSCPSSRSKPHLALSTKKEATTINRRLELLGLERLADRRPQVCQLRYIAVPVQPLR